MPTSATNIHRQAWGVAPDGQEVVHFTVRNGPLELGLTSMGARVTSLRTPDRAGNVEDVVLGFQALTPYLADKAFLGCTVGRYANRIADGRFELDGQVFDLDRNDGLHTLHGGSGGLWNRNWESSELPDGVRFRIVSPAGEQGFPGTLTVNATYRVEGHQVHMEYEATTDAPTVVNLTNHAYFNLAGEGTQTVLDHVVQIQADRFTPIDATAIPLGGLEAVAGSPFDFTRPHTIGERIHEANSQLLNGSGYDHNFVLRGEAGTLRPAATVTHPASGRQLQVATTEPGVQFYSGNHLDGSALGKMGAPYSFRSAFCLETQHFPDSPNQPAFPSTTLRPGETLRSRTVWTFGVEG